MAKSWEDLADVVLAQVPADTVTTYGDLHEKLGYGENASPAHAVVAMIKKWESQDPRARTHRVVRYNGALSQPDQDQKLREEGVTFVRPGVVDMAKHRVTLT